MGDLTDIQAAQSVKIAGADPSTGAESFWAQVNSDGSVVTRDQSNADSAAGTVATKSGLIGGQYKATLPVLTDGQQVAIQTDKNGRLLTATAVVSSLPAATFSNQSAINAGVTKYTAFTASQKIALKQLYAGGTGIGRQALYSYVPATVQFVPFGDFETNGDVSNWPYFSFGGSGTGSAALSTAQFFTATHSVAMTFTTSDANHSNGVKQTFSAVQDFSQWRYITAEFFNTVSVGATYTRTISIVLTDSNGSTKKFDVSGLSNASPFNASAWIKITGELTNPTSSTGTSFDLTAVASMELRMVDSASRAGTVYWDTARLEASTVPIFPIYHYSNTSFNIPIDPVVVLQIGDQILFAQTNNDSTKQEYYIFSGGVGIT